MPAPKGSQNRHKNKPWATAIDRALAHAGAKLKDDADENGNPLGPKSKALKAIANQIVAAALNGDRYAIEEIANRQDGKPVQSTQLAGEDGGSLIVNVLKLNGTQPPE